MTTTPCPHLLRVPSFGPITAGMWDSPNMMEWDPKYGYIVPNSHGAILIKCGDCGEILDRPPMTLSI